MYVAEGDRWGQGTTHVHLGMIAESTTDGATASSHYQKAVELLRPSRDATMLPFALIGQASVLLRREPAKALKIAAAASAIRARVGGEFAPFLASTPRTDPSRRRGCTRGRGRAAMGGGARLSVDEVVALAFGCGTPRSASPAGLSAREQEIAALVAEGLSNKAIASRLHVSVRTVESHVRHVLAKIGLSNRTQLATWAHERIQ